MVSAKKNMRLRSNEELIVQRRKTNSPTIEEDFTIDEDEPLDDLCSSPKAVTKYQFGERSNEDDAEVNWTKSDLSEKKNAKDKSKSVHSIFWSLSELEDSSTNTVSKNTIDQRKNATGKGRERLPDKIGKKAFSKSGVQFRDERKNRKPENFAIRTMRSIDEESNVFDEVSVFSVASRVPSVAVSVTKRTRNTRHPNLRSPRASLRSPRPPRTPRTVTEDSVLIEDAIQEEFEYGKNESVVHSQNEDLSNQFFEKVEDRVCESSHHRKSYKRNKKTGIRNIMSPLLEKFEKYDGIFEQLEDVLCAENASSKEAHHTPAALFAQILDQIDNFDTDFKSKVMDCQDSVDFYGYYTGYSSDEDDNDDDYSQSSNVSNEQIESSERTYNSFSSRQTRHYRTKKMKQQWRCAISKWKLRQSILAESVKHNAAKALSSWNPEIPETKEAENLSDALSHGPSDEGEHGTSNKPTTPTEWIKMWKNKVNSVSEKWLDRAQCASSSIKVTESASFDQEQNKNIDNQNSMIKTKENEVDFDDDLSDFQTAVSGIDSDTSEMNFEQDERPPMRRLMESRAPGAEQSISNSRSAQCRLLSDSIRHAPASDATKGTSRISKDPRGNKLKADGSTHVRSLPGLKLDLDVQLMKEHERIRSPRSSETNETSDLTAVASSTSDIMVTQMVTQNH